MCLTCVLECRPQQIQKKKITKMQILHSSAACYAFLSTIRFVFACHSDCALLYIFQTSDLFHQPSIKAAILYSLQQLCNNTADPTNDFACAIETAERYAQPRKHKHIYVWMFRLGTAIFPVNILVCEYFYLLAHTSFFCVCKTRWSTWRTFE